MYLKMKESLLFGLNRQSYTAFLQADGLKVKGAFGNRHKTGHLEVSPRTPGSCDYVLAPIF